MRITKAAVVTAVLLGAGGLVAVSPAVQASPPAVAGLSPELQRLLDQVGRHVSLRALAADGTLAGLQRATRTADPSSLDLTAEEADRPRSGKVGTPGKTFDMAWFERNLRAALAGRTVGYAYSIGKNGQLDRQAGVGLARVAPDNPVTAQSATKAMTIASVSKPVTTAAVLRLLEQKKISVDSGIGPWLPSAWKRGAGVDKITFRQLMTHTSGLLQNYQTATGTTGGKSTGSWDNIRIAIGQDSGSKGFKYANMNFSIFRIMVPKIAYGVDLSPQYDAPPANVTAAQIDYLTGIVFLGYLKPVLELAKASVGCANSDPNPTKLYAFPTGGQAGWGPADYTTGCGGYGYNMSANGITSFLSHIRYTDKVISAAARKLMVDENVGMYSYTGAYGTYHGHNGVWAQSGNRGMRSCAMSFHIHVDASLLVNNRGDYPSPCAVLLDAFDNAWH
ncbi:serine hydrolase domain-containing protein [Paractinoplanes lichenicola]|uniref:Serine hydrolase n=1 Tax=Paractinoplanes lichenicola TaxID=2802976 RepID=A0ABS1VDQ1_9ACTN|nr:serine hydrolase domain-containing protein [Actinoplanes lichenicola]MBL7252813.1 serine hydrolase [Actinoplanes lichenicola]